MTPSGGWVPAVIAGHTGIGLSQRMQAFVLDAADNPYNVLQPGKRPRATLTPTLASRRAGGGRGQPRGEGKKGRGGGGGGGGTW